MAFNLTGLFQRSGGSVPSQTTGGGSNTVYDLLNPSNARKAISGLLPGGASSNPKAEPSIGFQNSAGGSASSAAEDDWRVRISLSAGSRIFYQDPTIMSNAIMFPLLETNGVIFPHTPSVAVSHVANYGSHQLTHSNYAAHFYNNSEVADITITGDFTVQSAADGQYLMAAVYFFRSATKMFFGQGDNVGNPPPIVFLDGYGSHYLPHVPCVITSFAHTMPQDVDYVQVPISRSVLDTSPTPANQGVQLSAEEQRYVPSHLNSKSQATTASTLSRTQTRNKDITTSTRVPTASTITITVKPMYSRKNLHERFDLGKFAQGQLLQDNDKGYGGFI
jgi:hypothetical protein